MRQRTKLTPLSSHLNHRIICLHLIPLALITPIKVDGKNYDLWEQAVRKALGAKNKLGFIDGKITKPEMNKGDENSAIANAWEMLIL